MFFRRPKVESIDFEHCNTMTCAKQSFGSVESILVEGSVRNGYPKATNVRIMKSSTWRKTQQDGEVASFFDLWNIFSMSSFKDASGNGTSNILPNSHVLSMKLHFLSTNIHGINYG